MMFFFPALLRQSKLSKSKRNVGIVRQLTRSDWDGREALLNSPLASVSEPEDLLWRREYLLALLFAAHCWLRVTMRSDEKVDSATAFDASAAESRATPALPVDGELLRIGLQLSRQKIKGWEKSI